jgi:hypothetical protein
VNGDPWKRPKQECNLSHLLEKGFATMRPEFDSGRVQAFQEEESRFREKEKH